MTLQTTGPISISEINTELNSVYTFGNIPLAGFTNFGFSLVSNTVSGTVVVNTNSVYIYGKGTNFPTDLKINDSIYIYSDSSGSSEVKLVSSVNVATYTFNSNNDVTDATDFINLFNLNSSHILASNDVVKYFTATGNTALTGLANATYYYVVSANTTGVKLSGTRGGANINITKSVTESGHYLALQKLTIDSNLTFTDTNAKIQLTNVSENRLLAQKYTGSVSMSNYLGKSRIFSANISTNQMRLGLGTWAKSQGWNGNSPAIITIDPGVYIWSDSTGVAALTTGDFPRGLTIINYGYIMGMGGAGGKGNSGPPSAGFVGGPAISLSTNTTINMAGTTSYIGGGGGGGGGNSWGGGGGGAGGGAGGSSFYSGTQVGGFGGAIGLAGANGQSRWSEYNEQGRGGSAGGGGGTGRDLNATDNCTAGGGGGRIFPGANTVSPGGDGGGPGVAGVNGTGRGGGGGGGWGAAGGSASYVGGAAGKAIALNSFIATLTGTTTRIYGAIS